MFFKIIQEFLKTLAALSAVLLLALGVGMATGVVPSSLFLSNDRDASQDCDECGVIENVKISTFSGPSPVAGEKIESNQLQDARFVVTVRMNNGRQHTIAQDTTPRFKTGDKVKIENNALVSGYF